RITLVPPSLTRHNRTIDADVVSRASCPRRNLDRMVSSRAIGYLLSLSLSSPPLLAGCDMVLLRPSGYVAAQQGHLVVISTLLMLLIVVPVIALTLVFAWHYRE